MTRPNNTRPSIVRILLQAVGLQAAQSSSRVVYLWEPTPDQVWHPKMKRADGRRLSAFAFYKMRFENAPPYEMPTLKQVRAHPKTRKFYDALCVYVSRNRTRGLTPDSILDLFPK